MQFLDPCNDIAFKKVFGSEKHKNITISFLNSILEYTGEKAIINVTFLNTEQHPLIIGDKKDNILDIMCIDQQGNQYIVEVQVKRVKEFGKRMVYYGAKTYAMQLGKGQPYHELMPVVTIAIVGFDMFPKKKNYKSIHQLLDTKTHEHDLQELTFAFVELKKFNKKEHELVSDEEKWLYFMKEIKKKNYVPETLSEENFEEACHIVERMKWSENDLNAYDDAFVRATDDQTALELATEEGAKKGRKEGLKEGLKKGEEQKAYEIAKNLLASGLAVEVVAQATGLSVEQVNEMAKTRKIV